MSQENGIPKRNPYTVGTLTYTKMGLMAVFFWVLWGDFCFSLMETIMPTLVPVTLHRTQASAKAIGIIVTTIPYLMSAIFCPIISFKSDRHRGKWGRRIPFLLWPTPFIALFLILTGYSASIGAWLHGWLASGLHLSGLSPAFVILIVTGFCMVGFTFFNQFVGSIYYYLWADVVPEHFMGRFMAAFRLVSNGAGMIWLYYLVGLADKYMTALFVGIGIVYFVIFTLMCLRVKEGEYPPPPPSECGEGFVGLFRTYFRECFRNRYYIWFFLGTTLTEMTLCAKPFLILFYNDTLQLSLDKFGKISFWSSAATMVLMIPAGYLSDRLHPLRLVILGLIGTLIVTVLSFFFIKDAGSMLLFQLMGVLPGVLYGVANLPMYVALLPKERYGQFCSAQAMVRSVAVIFGGYAAGALIDWTGSYRYYFIWTAVCLAASLIPMCMVYIGWKRHGGAKNYVAPPVAAVRHGPLE